MTDLTYDPEYPYVVLTPGGNPIARLRSKNDAKDLASMAPGRVIEDSTPKPKIPEDAEFIAWNEPNNGEGRIARRHGHSANKVWRMGWGTIEESELISHIGDAEVTVLVRKEES